MNTAKRLDKTSGHLFLAGFLIAKFRLIPLPLISLIVNTLSLIIYLVGYCLWAIACQLAPSQPALKDMWYGFSQFKTQSQVSALVGLVATICCLTAFIAPPLMLPALWLFSISNVFWCLAEYHKIHNPPTYDADYSSTRQEEYLKYALIMTGLSILSSLVTTTALLVPVTALIIVPVSTAVILLFSFIALNYWVDFNFCTHQPDKQANQEPLPDHSYSHMASALSLTPLCSITAPCHQDSLAERVYYASPLTDTTLSTQQVLSSQEPDTNRAFVK